MPATVWTSEREAAFLAALRATRSVKAACAAAGVDRATAYRRRLANASFRAAWDRAWTEAADATEVAMSAILADPAASSAAKIRAAAALRSAHRFRDKPWGSGIAAKAARGSSERQHEAAAAVVTPEVAAAVAKARADAEAAFEPWRDQLPEQVLRDALSLGTCYLAMFQGRDMELAPHLLPLVVALVDPAVNQLLVVIGPGSGKSSLVSVAYPCWCLGERDPALTTLLISAGESLVDGFRTSIAQIIDESREYRALYPHVRPDKDRGWSSERGLFTTGHAASDPDASVYATGISSSTLTGKHARLIIVDDCHDEGNSATALQRERIISTFYLTIKGRGDPRGARYIVAGRRYGEGDLYGHLEAAGDWCVFRLPALRGGGDDTYYDVTVPDELEDSVSFTALLAPAVPDVPLDGEEAHEPPVADIVVFEGDGVTYEPLDPNRFVCRDMFPGGLRVTRKRLDTPVAPSRGPMFGGDHG